MEAMAAEPSSPAPAAAANLSAPPYHHCPASADQVVTPQLKPKQSTTGPGLRVPSPSPSVQVSGYSLHDLLLQSPPPPSSRRHRPRTRGAAGTSVDESLEIVAVVGVPTPPKPRRRGGAEHCVAPTLASPRKARRARRKLEKDVEAEEDAARRTRRRKSTRAVSKAAAAVLNKEDTTMALVTACPVSTSGLWESIVELVMWRNVAKSAFWFGSGSMFFSYSFSRYVTFSPISALCHLGVMILGLAFLQGFCISEVENKRSFQLTEEDILRASQAILPIANSVISTAQMIFSGEPSMTLKVLPVLLFGAKYGGLVTMWRLLAAGFFTSVTVPKLYCSYSSQIHKIVEILRDQALEGWKSCPRKKLVAAIVVTMCWNMFSVKRRVMAAFVSLVILRYNQKYKENMMAEVGSCRDEQGQAMEMDD